MSEPADILARHRFEYETAGLDVGEVDPDPMTQWRRWFGDAVDAGCTEPNAFVLSTVDQNGWPQSRYLLLRAADERGFTCFTNYESAKSRELADTGRASMLFTWLQLHRQVRVTATAERVPDAESDEYFASRPRGSQIGAWSSPQSQPIADRDWLEQRVQQMAATFVDAEVPRPAFWGGWLLRPETFEFWQGRPSRLHDRLRYTRGQRDAAAWHVTRLSP
jgi:pyridoxamine 5'-phosphate oxidase